MGISNIPDWVKILMLKGEKGDPGGTPTMSEEPIDNGNRITIVNADGTTSTFDLHNATSGDYSGLTNKPSINNVLVSGDKTGGDYGLANVADVYTKDDYIILSGTVTVASGTYFKREKIADNATLASYSISSANDVAVISISTRDTSLMNPIYHFGTGDAYNTDANADVYPKLTWDDEPDSDFYGGIYLTVAKTVRDIESVFAYRIVLLRL